MFSQHPFTIPQRYTLDSAPALPVWKRVLDVTCCITALPLLLVATCVITAITHLRSRGPVVFRQKSIGYLGRSFGAYRFRTMHVVASSVPQQIPNSRHQTESTVSIPGGRFLRASGLVDLPQIVNVLRGEMSIVGLRPCSDLESTSRGAGQRNDLAAVPGLTGLWRLAGENETRRDESARWEETYFANLSFASDLKIIAQSLLAIFRSAWR